MHTLSPATEAVVRHHLQAFLESQGVDAIVADYDEAAHFLTEAKVYDGKQEIRGFFKAFIDALPEGGIDRFELKSLQVEGNVACITWSVGSEIPLGTDTFVVEDGKIVAQTFAMHVPPAH
jgi:ketosteroid isomerase-like protein